MQIAVWGMGYVGSVTAVSLARLGHHVVGIESNPSKVDAINAGDSPVREPGLASAIRDEVAAGRLRAVADPAGELSSADMSLICVGTPTGPDGTPDLSHVEAVATALGTQLGPTGNPHTVVVRSTVPPGTTRGLVLPLMIAASRRAAGSNLHVAVNPEFLREGTALADFEAPSMTVIGADDDAAVAAVEELYERIPAPIRRMSLEEAELLKLVNNAFHALKIGFANEIGRLCDRIGLDSHVLMNAVVADTRLNISPAYLQPGFAFGGSCLPKDLRSLGHELRNVGVRAPILEGLMDSNGQQIEEAIRKVKASGARNVAVLGLAFKAGTDDLRESPLVRLVELLWKDGYTVKVHDPDVDLAGMVGQNRAFVERQLPQIASILTPTIEEALEGVDLTIIGQRRPQFARAIARLSGGVVLDLVRLTEERTPRTPATYRGLSW